jgi:tetratricopeptide (TPR) repeat protein
MLCFSYYFAGDLERARPPGLEAVERARNLGDDVLLGLGLYTYVLALDAPSASGPLYAEAIACTERSGDLRVNAYLHNEAGLAALQTGNLAGAKAHPQAGMRAAQAIGDSPLVMLVSLAFVRRAEEDFDDALSILQELIRIGRRIGSSTALAFAILGLACVSTDLRYWHRAAMLHGIAQAILDPTGLPWQPLDARYRQQSVDQIDKEMGREQREGAFADGHGAQLRPSH